MFYCAGIVHERDNRIGNGRMPCVSGFGSHAQIGKPDAGSRDVIDWGKILLFCTALERNKQQPEIDYTEEHKEDYEKIYRSSRYFFIMNIHLSPCRILDVRIDCTRSSVISSKVITLVPL